jgi:hypothetical protein
VLDPDNRNIWMSAADSITGTSRNLRETSDPADFNYNPADPPRLNAIQTALVHARELADAALEVEANDPLWRHYFGDDSEEAQQIVRRQ